MNLSRRTVLGAAAAMSARGWSSLASGESPAERIRVGVIGTGVRGKYLISNLPRPAVVTSLCDCATSQIASTLRPSGEFAALLQDFNTNDAAHCTVHQDYRPMIDREDLDAVIIAAPDHHHVRAAMLAIDAGLDVYLEKPVSLTIREGRILSDMVRSTGRVLQVGSQQRTMETNRFACQFVRDGGLGKVTRVDCPNYPGPIRGGSFPAEAVPEGMDWNLFLGPTPNRSYNRHWWVKDEFDVDGRPWRGWDLFEDFSGHLMTNWVPTTWTWCSMPWGWTNPVR